MRCKGEEGGREGRREGKGHVAGKGQQKGERWGAERGRANEDESCNFSALCQILRMTIFAKYKIQLS